MTLERVKASRRDEATRAAEALGASVQFMDAGDYPLRVSDERLFDLVRIYRMLQPELVLTHSLRDPYNFDHPLASQVAQEARIVAQAHGHEPGDACHRRAAACSCSSRTRPERCDCQPRRAARYHAGVGQEADAAMRTHGGAGASVGVLHPRGAAQRGVQAGATATARAEPTPRAYQRHVPRKSPRSCA